MGKISLFLPVNMIVCWRILFEPFGSNSGIGTSPAFFRRIICSLAMKTGCNRSEYRSFRVLFRRIISLLLFIFHPFTTISDNVACFFTLVAYDFSLFSVLLNITWRYGCYCGYCQFPIILQTTDF